MPLVVVCGIAGAGSVAPTERFGMKIGTVGTLNDVDRVVVLKDVEDRVEEEVSRTDRGVVEGSSLSRRISMIEFSLQLSESQHTFSHELKTWLYKFLR